MSHDQRGEHRVGRQQADEPRPAFVRPFTLTGGRTVPLTDLPLEATLQVTDDARSRMWPAGAKADVVGVAHGRSVAEVSAHLNLPIGVVRVILADLVIDGHVHVQRTLRQNSTLDERRDLLERTLRGLRVS